MLAATDMILALRQVHARSCLPGWMLACCLLLLLLRCLCVPLLDRTSMLYMYADSMTILSHDRRKA